MDIFSSKVITHDSPNIDEISHATHIGNRYDIIYHFVVSIDQPLYLVFNVPTGKNININLIQRYFQCIDGGAKLQIFWDYDINGSTKTPLTIFNSNTKYRDNVSVFEISTLNNLTEADGSYIVSGDVNIINGIIRETSIIHTSGKGSNISGGINASSGIRTYTEGNGFLLKLTSDTNDNNIILGYAFYED